jgi:hypothetical protein
MQFAIRRGMDDGRTERTRTDKAKDEVKLSKVGGYAFVDAARDTLAEDIAKIKTGRYGEIVVPIAHHPKKLFFQGAFDAEATHALEDDHPEIILVANGGTYVIRPEGSRDTVIERIA